MGASSKLGGMMGNKAAEASIAQRRATGHVHYVQQPRASSILEHGNEDTALDHRRRSGVRAQLAFDARADENSRLQ